jgi:hypothetical protein
LIFGTSEKSEEYWATDLKQAVALKFEQALTVEEQQLRYPLKVLFHSVMTAVYSGLVGSADVLR